MKELIRGLGLLLVLVALLVGCTSTTNVTGPSCNASSGATASTSGSGNAEGVEAGSSGSGTSEAGCTGGRIVQE